jgi:hypothetical protein
MWRKQWKEEGKEGGKREKEVFSFRPVMGQGPSAPGGLPGKKKDDDKVRFV